jgi:two-component system chemotaxis sensor kinase CheA
MVEVDDIIKEFLVESQENLDQLDRDLVALEESPDDKARLSSVFRTIHTIKGTSGFLAFGKLEHLTHTGENLLARLRDGVLSLNGEIATALLAMVDAVRSILANIEATAAEGDEDYESLVATLAALQSDGSVAAEPAAFIAEEDATDEPAAATGEVWPIEADVTTPDEAPPVQETEAPAEVGAIAAGKPAFDGGDRSHAVADSTVRIDVQLLDKLMNLVGELVLARNQILQFNQHLEDAAMASASQRLNLITTELQEGVMKTRMQPIGNAWSKLPRVVRDLSRTCGKQVQVKMDGAETELDKTILEAIKDPLTHIVRNSVDHGIESPQDRIRAGKPAEGTLLLRAFHEGGQVNIEISDDGGGISVDRIRWKAVERGLVSREQAESMSDRDAIQLILLPGFSTAEKVTNVSGRGVGMDVVKTNVEKIGGTLEIQSKQGVGTTLRIKIPLTLAIVPALIVTCDDELYSIPQVSLLELIRLDATRARQEIELLHSVPVYRRRGQLLPLVYLDEELGLRPRRTDDERRNAEVVNIVVLQAEDRQFGLVVDHVNDTQEIVVKPLGQHLKSISFYAGATIMGDGSVSLILDVIGIARQGHVLGEHSSRSRLDVPRRSDSIGTRQSFLIVDPGDGSRAAIPLSEVARLEKIPAKSIERTRYSDVVQYRGKIMPLVSLNGRFEEPSDCDETLALVVYRNEQRSVGIVVGRIVDIVEVDGFEDTDRPTRIIAGRVTDMVDLAALAASVA